jgi:glycosyltransferase involved in cell wall biosynthesis
VGGDGGALEEAKRYVTARNITGVQFVGHVSGVDKVQALRMADCYLFPSYEEGMPISVLEAMAFGVPVITRPVGALADFFSNGDMGFMTESKSPEVLARLMNTLIGDPAACNRMGRYNRDYALKHFTASQVAAEIESIYRDVLKDSYAGI